MKPLLLKERGARNRKHIFQVGGMFCYVFDLRIPFETPFPRVAAELFV